MCSPGRNAPEVVQNSEALILFCNFCCRPEALLARFWTEVVLLAKVNLTKSLLPFPHHFLTPPSPKLQPAVSMNNTLIQWALPRLSQLLPVDEASLKEIIIYSASLSKSEGADHLRNLLGDSPQALEFISSFNSRREVISSSATSHATEHAVTIGALTGVPKPQPRSAKKAKPPLHSAGPVRRPEGYGDVIGSYLKSNDSGQSLVAPQRPTSATASPLPSDTLKTSNLLHVTNDDQFQQPSSATSSRDASPRPPKLPPSAAGSLTSDLLNVKTKHVKQTHRSGTSSPRKAATTTTGNIADLTSAIAALELATNPTLSTDRRTCDCNASLHPLFTTAPNCLSCGKIICSLEGLQPCSFCNSPILTKDQVDSMIRALKEERGQERMTVHNVAVSSSGKGTPTFGVGRGGNTPESSGDEASEAASRARAHRDKLLAYQRENAQRTRIRDDAADYDMTLTSGATQWMSPVQRAMALKKQQQYMREMEEQSKPEWEKKRTVMSMSIRNGKLVRTYESVKTASSVSTQDTEADQDDEPKAAKQAADMADKPRLSDNPLLADGKLIRPTWQPAADAKGKGRADDQRRTNRWRRVQDDDEDNEQWILDGGTHGFSQGDDGSRAE